MSEQKKYVGENALLYVWGKVKTLVAGKVDKETGKGLSTNDYTTTEKNKLSGIATGAEVNKINVIKVNNTAQTISSKTVNITVPTKTSDLTNDNSTVIDANYVHTDNNYTTTEKNKLSGIASGAEVNAISTIKVNNTAQTISNKTVNITVPTNTNQLTNGAGFKNETEVNALIASAIEGITGFNYEIVQTLPATRQCRNNLFNIK